MSWLPLLLSLRVLAFAVPLITVLGVSLALLLARRRFPGRAILEGLILLPLLLPPSVLGYYLLLILGRANPLLAALDLRVLFTWPAAVVAGTIVGLPLVVQAAKGAIASVDPVLEDAARTLGATEWEVLRRITLPLARRGILAGIILGSARAMGEFGATLMIAGNIPGRTQTMPLAIYDAVQNREYALANAMVVLLTGFSLLAPWLVRRLEASAERPASTRARSPHA